MPLCDSVRARAVAFIAVDLAPLAALLAVDFAFGIPAKFGMDAGKLSVPTMPVRKAFGVPSIYQP